MVPGLMSSPHPSHHQHMSPCHDSTCPQEVPLSHHSHWMHRCGPSGGQAATGAPGRRVVSHGWPGTEWPGLRIRPGKPPGPPRSRPVVVYMGNSFTNLWPDPGRQLASSYLVKLVKR